MKLAALLAATSSKDDVDECLHLDGRGDLARRAASRSHRADGRYAANTLGLEGLAVAITGLIGMAGVDDTAALTPSIVGGTTTATAALDELYALHCLAPAIRGFLGSE